MFGKNSIKTKFLKIMSVVVVGFLIVITALSYNGAKNELEKSVKQNLKVLSESIYQSMTNSMLSGLPEHVKTAKENAEKLDSVDYLDISKSKIVLKDFGLNEKYTDNSEILGVFKTKKPVISEIKGEKHQMKILKPFIAENRCLSCHVSAKKGDVLGVLDLRVSLAESDAKINFFTTMMSLSNIFLAFVLLVVTALLLDRFVIKQLQQMHSFIKSLSKGKKDLKKRVPVESSDELGDIAEEFNKYLNSIEETHNRERKFIQEANKSIKTAKQGSYDNLITASVESETLTEFKNSVNDMIQETKKNFETINTVLTQYTAHNYKNDIELKNISKDGDFDKLIKHINKLKEVITMMLVGNKKNGLILDKSSDILLDNVSLLDDNSLKTEKSLDSANKFLDQITKNITINSSNVVKMSNLANNVTKSSKNGEELANQTVNAMDQINKEVSQIKEAISLIDQIAFQTNILSLNAAVEAATAGDAGKGFAVVASEVRNLASKSATAAQNIKELVESATKKTFNGKEIATKMIDGYNDLNENILNTVEYINDIEKASKEQQNAILEINKTIQKVTLQTKENSKITKTTKDIAVKTDEMAKYVVKKVNEKEFEGKEEITIENV